MFSTISDIKEFLEWAKAQGIQAVKVGDLEVQFSALALLPADALKDISNGGATTLAETEPLDKQEDDDILFHSSN